MYFIRLLQPIIPAIALGLTACASIPAETPALPKFQRIAIITTGTTKKDLQADSTTYIDATRIGGGAAAGAAAGAAIGLACGPGAFLCVPLTATIGAISGAWAGNAAKTEKGLRKQHNQQVNEVLQNLSTNLELNEMLHKSLSAKVPDGIETTESEAEAFIQVRVKSLELHQYEKEMLSLNMIVEMRTYWGFRDEKPTIQTNQYQYETAHEAAKNWLVNEGERFSHGITECVDRIAGYMARDLDQPTESQLD
jgi:outer membrane lipoprotein SlyB